MGWVSPTSHNDPASAWTNPHQCYDDDPGTLGLDPAIPTESYGEFLELIRAAVDCDKIRYNALCQHVDFGKIDVDVFYDEDWHDVHEGDFARNEWEERSIPAGTKSVTKARVRFYNDHLSEAKYGAMRDFDFNEVEVVGRSFGYIIG